MGFIPMQFSLTNMTALEPYLSKALKFSPPAAAKLFLKPHNISDAASDGHCFNFLYFSNYFKIHLKFHL
jgi:hypothetical protein